MSSAAAARTTGRGGDDDKFYPPPLTSHEDIVNDAKLFLDTLRKFHFVMGSKYMMDFHTLYVEVTRMSGDEKVVAEKKWREVGSVFNFSLTTTSVSYVLKKHYWNLLYDFEQVHFFKVRGPITSPADALYGSNSSGKPDFALVKYAPKHANNDPESNVEVPPPSSILQDVGAIVSFNLKARHSGRRRRNMRRWDRDYPKPNRNGYNFFFAEKHTKLKELYPSREREFTKMIGQPRNNLSSDEKMVYQNIGGDRQGKVSERIGRVQGENEALATRRGCRR
ncbi:high mobility group B protein 9-like [Lotus japonicus]|uniref:high mobility group B protein 9-like n=1 Tax=Lotus japonicus TaxID=34305 RepID=UPI0025884FB9|nr:high mobility group B protein 9-like [Lotus japonicus]